MYQYVIKYLGPSCAKFEQQYSPRPLESASSATPTGQLPSEIPLISIVVPSFNQAAFLEQTLTSIISQNYPKLELVVVDGGSSDESPRIIEEYGAYIAWSVSESDNGQAHAINKGMAKVTGDIMAWLNSDDILLPGTLWRVAQEFAADRSVDAIYGHRKIIDKTGAEIGEWVLPEHDTEVLYYADYIPQETLFWRRALWQASGGSIDESFHFALDWDLLLRFVEAGATFKRINRFLGGFRRHELQKTIAEIDERGFQEMELLRARSANKLLGLNDVPRRRMNYRIAKYLLRAKIFEVFQDIE